MNIAATLRLKYLFSTFDHIIDKLACTVRLTRQHFIGWSWYPNSSVSLAPIRCRPFLFFNRLVLNTQHSSELKIFFSRQCIVGSFRLSTTSAIMTFTLNILILLEEYSQDCSFSEFCSFHWTSNAIDVGHSHQSSQGLGAFAEVRRSPMFFTESKGFTCYLYLFRPRLVDRMYRCTVRLGTCLSFIFLEIWSLL